MLLDTHVWIWWLSQPARLSAPASQAMAEAEQSSALWVSSMSAWELAMLIRAGRLTMTCTAQEEWIADSERLPTLRFIPVSNRIAVSSVQLPELHKDPADRIIAATALAHGLTLVTADHKLIACPYLNTLW